MIYDMNIKEIKYVKKARILLSKKANEMYIDEYTIKSGFMILHKVFQKKDGSKKELITKEYLSINYEDYNTLIISTYDAFSSYDKTLTEVLIDDESSYITFKYGQHTKLTVDGNLQSNGKTLDSIFQKAIENAEKVYID